MSAAAQRQPASWPGPEMQGPSPEPFAPMLRPTRVTPSRALRNAATICVLSVLLTGCGVIDSVMSGSGELEAPPPVTVHYGNSAIVLNAHSYCFGNGCADGMPPSPLPDVGAAPEVRIVFPRKDWSFMASFTPASTTCGRTQSVSLKQAEDGSHILTPVGLAGTYDVTLAGTGDGDLATAFRWSTPSDGPLPLPEAQMAVLADNDGAVDSYGVELNIANLARTPKQASARITLRAANQKSLTLTPSRRASGCQAEGSISWDGPVRDGLRAARMGPPPFTYRVVLTIDGIRHVAAARWPDDVMRGNEPYVRLTFVPTLPAL